MSRGGSGLGRRMLVGSLAVGLMLVAGSGCRRTYNTTAIYEAMAGGYRAEVTSSGSFSTDHDLNPVPTGRATITPVRPGSHPTITMDLPGNGTVRQVTGQAPAVVSPWGSLETVPTLKAILAGAGYATLPDDEVEAMSQAIEGVTLGPKGTMMPGQGAVLRIVRVVVR